MQSDPDKQKTDLIATIQRFLQTLACIVQKIPQKIPQKISQVIDPGKLSRRKETVRKVFQAAARSMAAGASVLGKTLRSSAGMTARNLNRILRRLRSMFNGAAAAVTAAAAALCAAAAEKGTGTGIRSAAAAYRAGRGDRPKVSSYRKRRRGSAPWVIPAATGAAALVLGLCLFMTLPAGRTLGAGNNARTAGASQTAGGVRSFQSGTVDAAERIPLAASFRGMMEGVEEAAVSAREQARRSLQDQYRAILDRGMGASFVPETEYGKALWQEVRNLRREELEKDPFLILVNQWHYLPEGYEADPVDLPNGQRIGDDCYEPLMQMLADCAAAGGTPIVCSGYRPHWHQVNLFDAQINRWLYAGYGQEDAEALAATAVAIPGTSEHELGLAADIYSTENMDLDESQVYTLTQQWLMENSWRYGFVLRYPKDKSEITGIIFEPWHYRYVGKEHAKKIYDAGICLEEYLDLAEHP